MTEKIPRDQIIDPNQDHDYRGEQDIKKIISMLEEMVIKPGYDANVSPGAGDSSWGDIRIPAKHVKGFVEFLRSATIPARCPAAETVEEGIHICHLAPGRECPKQIHVHDNDEPLCEEQPPGINKEIKRCIPGYTISNMCFGTFHRKWPVCEECHDKDRCQEKQTMISIEIQNSINKTHKEILNQTITLMEEIESGITSYEKEHESHQVRDDCLGIYIPSNVVRRLIQPRKEFLMKIIGDKS